MKTAVVIPNWNGIEFLDSCLKALSAQTRQTHIIFVDNGSDDGSSGFVKSKYPKVEIVQLDANQGFAGGVNRGIEVALRDDFTYIALLNNDAVVAINWIEALEDNMEKENGAGIVTSKILSMDKSTIDSTGEIYSIWGAPFPRGRGEVDTGQYDSKENKEIFAASGGASMYRADLFRKIGLFDERFFAYYEDVDISFRAQLAGWKVLYEPKAHVYHHISGTSSKLGSFSQYHMLKNTWYLFVKNMPRKLFYKHLFKMIFALKMKTFALLMKLEFRVVFKAWMQILKNLPGVISDRRKIQKSAQASAEYIDSMLYHDLSPSQKQKKIYRLLSRK